MYEYNLAIRFQRVAADHPQRIALWLGYDESITYEELNKLANRLARVLSARGVGAGDVVCLSGRKTIRTFAFIIGCLKIGAVYSVLDPDSPTERLCKILASCAPRLVIWEQESSAQFLLLGFPFLEKESNVVGDVTQEENLPESYTITGSHPAYIMFTSGSTGFPKGAVMTHDNVLNLIEWAGEAFQITPDDILTNVNPLYFDNSVFDFYSALFTGACLAPFSKEETQDPRLLVEKVEAAACTLWFSVPSLLIFLQTMRATDGKHLGSIRRFIFGGEGYPKAKLKSLYEAYPNARLFNVYGPTECTCICSCHELVAEDFSDLHGLPRLGRIITNFAFLILDEYGREVSAGEIGELCLLGPNVGKGYYNDPEQTAASFVQNPYNRKFSEVMYKTGDLVKTDASGDLHIQGRRDNQIKHMGYRIELEEIEAALHCLAYVSQAAVLHTTANGLSRIVAIVSTDGELDSDRIRLDLRQIIPAYMIPSVFYGEDLLPRNPNGKVDRQWLAQKYLEPGSVKESVSI